MYITLPPGPVAANNIHETLNQVNTEFEYYLSETKHGMLNLRSVGEYNYKKYNLQPLKVSCNQSLKINLVFLVWQNLMENALLSEGKL